MEGKPHSSKSYSTTGRLSRMKQDLLSCSKDLKSSFQQRTAIRARGAFLSSGGATERPHVGVVGAGLAGLRCAEILISEGAKVTILEARDRLGGRIHQSSLLGRAVDMGPNWIHGTDSNPIVKLAKETNTTLRLIDDTTCVFDPQGLPMSKEKATGGFEKVWSMISDAFKYSNEDSANIAPSLSLKDFFREKLAEQTLCSDDQDLILLLAEMWGSFIGDPWERQSLKWFWLEECLDGDNLYVAESHEAILRCVAESVMINADIHLSTTVKSIENKSSKGEDPKVVVSTDDCNFEFDEVVVAVPLGCLKRGTPTLIPSIPPRISRAIRNASYSCLEKVYIAFPVAFWEAPTLEAQSAETKSPTTASTFPSFVHFLHPTYVPEQQKSWTLELVPLSSPVLFGNQAQATLLFYMYGPCATHVTSLIRPFSPTSTEYINAIDEFFRPYYSLLPNYKDCHPDCTPSAVLATDWQNDDLAGNGSYTNFQISDEIGEGEEEVLLDEDVRVLREGLPEQGIWFAGEHTAPFVALGTSTGAYWSGESAGMRILGANGLLHKYSDSHHTEYC